MYYIFFDDKESNNIHQPVFNDFEIAHYCLLLFVYDYGLYLYK